MKREAGRASGGRTDDDDIGGRQHRYATCHFDRADQADLTPGLEVQTQVLDGLVLDTAQTTNACPNCVNSQKERECTCMVLIQGTRNRHFAA